MFAFNENMLEKKRIFLYNILGNAKRRRERRNEYFEKDGGPITNRFVAVFLHARFCGNNDYSFLCG